MSSDQVYGTEIIVAALIFWVFSLTHDLLCRYIAKK